MRERLSPDAWQVITEMAERLANEVEDDDGVLSAADHELVGMLSAAGYVVVGVLGAAGGEVGGVPRAADHEVVGVLSAAGR